MLFGAGGVTRTHDLLITNYNPLEKSTSGYTRKA